MTSEMLAAVDAPPYTGTSPSPARAWAPWVIATSAVTAGCNAIQCVLNLIERHYQQQRRSLNPPSPVRIENMVNAIHTVSTLGLVSATVFVVVGVTWSVKRRSRVRLRTGGESAVEPALWRAAPVVYVVFWTALAAGLLVSLMVSAAAHPDMSIGDFVTYRTRLAISAGCRTVMWLCWIPLVVKATQLQARREASSDGISA